MMHQRAPDSRSHGLDPTLLLSFLLPVFAWAPLTYPGYFVFRSGFLPIFNLSDRVAHLGDLAWLPLVGRSYSLLGGEGPLPYLLGALPAALGVSPVVVVKGVFGLSLVLGSVGAYLWVRGRLQARWAALVAAAVYVFNPITLRLVYVDGAFACAVLLALMPFVLLAADRTLAGQRKAALWLGLLPAAAIWTQPGLGLAFWFLTLMYVLALRRMEGVDAAGFKTALAGAAGGLALGVLGLLPSVLQHGAGGAGWPTPNWLALLTPWLALLGGWLAVRLGQSLGDQEADAKPALFACLIGLALLLVYGDVQPVTTAVVIPDAPIAIFGENEIALLSVKTEGMPGPNGSVAITVEWQALRPLTRDYTVFFHVIAGNDQRYGQLDTMPQDGKLPTSQWQPGEVVRDRYEAKLSADAPFPMSAGADYRDWLGWYFGATGERLAVQATASSASDDKYIVKP